MQQGEPAASDAALFMECCGMLQQTQSWAAERKEEENQKELRENLNVRCTPRRSASPAQIPHPAVYFTVLCSSPAACHSIVSK